jgi:tRNA U34 5-methylaminomethyl-2-thiouridine-forming methyltransferase MnmC
VKQNAIQPANLEFNAEGTPVSRDFDDVYFSNDNGLEETRYVFLDGNQLSTRFPEHPRSLFVVAESGFGTGLNFLTLWQAFDQFHAATLRLRYKDYISSVSKNSRSPRTICAGAPALAGACALGRAASGAVAAPSAAAIV